MKIVAYHVSKKQYSVGQAVTRNEYLDVAASRGNTWVEELLERHRPMNALNRMNCVYTFPSIEQLGYSADWLADSRLRYYKVEIPRAVNYCPTALTGLILEKRGEPDSYLGQVPSTGISSKYLVSHLKLLRNCLDLVSR